MQNGRKDDTAADTCGAVVRPPRLFLGGLILGIGLDQVWPVALSPGGLPGAARYLGGAVLVAAAIALAGYAMRGFSAAGTNVPTVLPATALVTSGPHGFSRNPIYVAMAMLYAGISVLFDSALILALLAPIMLVMRVGVIAREEAYLERKFGDDYRRYKARVRRWL